MKTTVSKSSLVEISQFQTIINIFCKLMKFTTTSLFLSFALHKKKVQCRRCKCRTRYWTDMIYYRFFGIKLQYDLSSMQCNLHIEDGADKILFTAPYIRWSKSAETCHAICIDLTTFGFQSWQLFPAAPTS